MNKLKLRIIIDSCIKIKCYGYLLLNLVFYDNKTRLCRAMISKHKHAMNSRLWNHHPELTLDLERQDCCWPGESTTWGCLMARCQQLFLNSELCSEDRLPQFKSKRNQCNFPILKMNLLCNSIVSWMWWFHQGNVREVHKGFRGRG